MARSKSMIRDLRRRNRKGLKKRKKDTFSKRVGLVLLEVRLLQLLRGHLRGHEVGSSLDSVALLALLLHLLDGLLVRDLHLRVIGRVVDLGVL